MGATNSTALERCLKPQCTTRTPLEKALGHLHGGPRTAGQGSRTRPDTAEITAQREAGKQQLAKQLRRLTQAPPGGEQTGSAG